MTWYVRFVVWATAVTLFGAVFAACAGAYETTAPTQDLKEARAPGTNPTSSPSNPANLLVDTEWRLVEIQSMDDAQGTTKPVNPSLYTIRLDGDGTASMHLNCNRARGTWKAEPSSDPSSGRFEFGPLAVTRALCPPPSLDERVTQDAQYVRSYLLKDGRLYLSLMADGGIYTWEPQLPEKSLTSAMRTTGTEGKECGLLSPASPVPRNW